MVSQTRPDIQMTVDIYIFNYHYLHLSHVFFLIETASIRLRISKGNNDSWINIYVCIWCACLDQISYMHGITCLSSMYTWLCKGYVWRGYASGICVYYDLVAFMCVLCMTVLSVCMAVLCICGVMCVQVGAGYVCITYVCAVCGCVYLCIICVVYLWVLCMC